jgi:hypothetical protein
VKNAREGKDLLSTLSARRRIDRLPGFNSKGELYMKKTIPAAILLMSVAMLFLLPAPAGATPTAYVKAQVRVPGGGASGPNSFPEATSSTASVSVTGSFTTSGGSTGYMTANANGGDSPSLSLTGYATGDITKSVWEGIASDGYANMTYYYRVTGPSNVSVPLIFTFASDYSVATTGTGNTTSGIAYLRFLPGTYAYAFGPMYTTSVTNSLLGSHVANGTVSAGTWYQVFMYIKLYLADNDSTRAGGITGTGTSSGTIWIDPTITIDPAWLASNPGYTLQFDTVTAAPLPPAFLLLGPGLVGLAAVRRRLKK